MLIILAPAKLNLTLEVLAERPDGFHEIRSIVQTISLCDNIRFQRSHDVTFRADTPDWIPGKSLLSETVNLLQETTGCAKGVNIEISKRIPLVAGLGGDSSGAAATLCGLNQLWELGLSSKELLGLAAQLGSDVSFFLYGGTVLVGGGGEVITPVPPMPHRWFVLVVPRVPRIPQKTAQLYSSLQDNHYSDGRITDNLAEALKAGKEIPASLLFNTFENVAFTRFAELSVYREHMMKTGADSVHLTGSGPTLFTMLAERCRAEELCLRFQRQGMETYIVDTLPEVDKTA